MDIGTLFSTSSLCLFGVWVLPEVYRQIGSFWVLNSGDMRGSTVDTCSCVSPRRLLDGGVMVLHSLVSSTLQASWDIPIHANQLIWTRQLRGRDMTMLAWTGSFFDRERAGHVRHCVRECTHVGPFACLSFHRVHRVLPIRSLVLRTLFPNITHRHGDVQRIWCRKH